MATMTLIMYKRKTNILSIAMNHYKVENLKAGETFLPSSDEALVELEQEFVCILCHDYVSCLALSLP